MQPSELEEQLHYFPFGKSGAGDYGTSMALYFSKRVEPIRHLMVETASKIPFPGKMDTFNIGDYGAADGTASFAWIRDMIEALKKEHGRDLQIQVIYEDQPINDFNSLFKRLSGLIQEPRSYVQDFKNIFVLASGTSFYKRCVPSHSMHVIFTSAAVNNLSSKGPSYKNSIYRFAPEEVKEAELFKLQAARDWEQFLVLRSVELKAGGALMTISLSRDYLDLLGMNKDAFMELLDVIWKDLKDEVVISSEEFSNVRVSSYHRNLQEMKAPFENAQSQVSKSGLYLECVKAFKMVCPFYEAWKEKKERLGVDDREEYARQLISCHRLWSNGIFLAALSDDRSPAEKETLLDEFYLRVQKRVLLYKPGEITHGCTYVYLCARKRDH